MPLTIMIVALVIAGVVGGVLIVLVIGIHAEDRRKSLTRLPPGPITAGTRRILGLSVDHTSCLYATHPQEGCPACRRPSVHERKEEV